VRHNQFLRGLSSFVLGGHFPLAKAGSSYKIGNDWRGIVAIGSQDMLGFRLPRPRMGSYNQLK